jgi:hypothetical protein
MGNQDFVFHFGSFLVLILITVLTLQKSIVELDTKRLEASLAIPAQIKILPGRVTRAVTDVDGVVLMKAAYNSINTGIDNLQIRERLDGFFTQIYSSLNSITLPTLDLGQSSRQNTEIK